MSKPDDTRPLGYATPTPTRRPRGSRLARWLLLVATAAALGLLASLALFWALLRSRGR
jgi:hypothetical protein